MYKEIIKEIFVDVLRLFQSIDCKFNKSIFPHALQLSITGKCNSHCVMCNIWRNQREKDLSPEELSLILKDSLFKKIRSVGVSGGEPTLREDFNLIIDAIINNLKKLKSFTLLTNCINTKEVSEKIQIAYNKCKTKNIRFLALLSLDGIGQIHDLNRGTKNNFKNFEKVRACLEQKKIPFGTGTTITPINCYYVDDILDYCLDNNIKYFEFRLGVDIKRLFNEGYEKSHFFTKEQLFHLKMFFHKLTVLPKTRNDIFYKSIFEQLAYNKKRLAGCTWQKRGVTLGPSGEISYCSVRSPILGNAKQNSAFDIYKNNFDIREKIIESYCDDCKHDLRGPLLLKKELSVTFIKWRGYYHIFKKQVERKFKFIGLGSKIRNNKIYYPIKNPTEAWKKVLITGWWGTETAGDKAILGELLYFLKKINPIVDIYITSYNDYITKQTFYELNEKYREIVPIDKIPKQTIKNMDAIIIGGGPLEEIYEVKYIRDVFLLANNKHTDRVIFGVGIDPHLSNKYKRLISDLLKLSTRSFFRDKESYLLAQKYGVGGKCGYACDPSMAYIDRLKNGLKREKKDYIATLLRANTLEYIKDMSFGNLAKKNTALGAIFASVLNAVSKKENKHIYLLPMHSFFVGGDDRIYNRKVAEKSNNNFLLERTYLSLKELVSRVYSAEAVISMRYHGHLFPFALEIPFLSIDYTGKEGKVNNFLKKIHYNYSMSWNDINCDNLYKKLNDVLNDKEKIINEIKTEKARTLKQLKEVYNNVFNVSLF